jgi:redox-sensitive bicupin YhaK (pirin superfamily)
MRGIRKIKKVYKGKPTLEGAGVRLRRLFGYYHVPQLDPFLLLDDFSSTIQEDFIKGFPWHPHRGIETITYVLEGRVEHQDSLGNDGIIGGGDVQWMTAGSGIIHQEMPQGDSGAGVQGFQLWANLPASEKMMNPRYRDVNKEVIPEAILETGVRIKVISGKVGQIEGPVRDIVIEPEYLDVEIPLGVTFKHQVKPDHTVLAYIFQGAGYFDDNRDCYAFEVEGGNYFDMERDCLISAGKVVLFSEGEEVHISSEKEDLRLLLISGKPLREPVAWHGPIVMNHREELRSAFEEYQKGTFIKYKV